ncbi:MAG TPA: FCD domain-containing protein, partial [Candidatus Binatia bacterium]|nr:FCD domain-containing protein [Candidatus Binatia bacterium]
AERATKKDIERMKDILEKQSQAVSRGETGVEADAELHFAIGQATQNQALEKLVSGLMELLSHSREESLQTLDRRKASIESHRKILAAIEQHNKTKAQEAMFNHIEQVEENVLSSRKLQANHDETRLEERSIS